MKTIMGTLAALALATVSLAASPVVHGSTPARQRTQGCDCRGTGICTCKPGQCRCPGCPIHHPRHRR